MVLTHAIADKTEAAYRRGDLFEKRRALMTGWERFASPQPTAGTEWLKKIRISCRFPWIFVGNLPERPEKL